MIDTTIEEFCYRVIRTTRVIHFDLIYKGIEVEGRFTEYMDDGFSNWDREVEIESNEELTDEDVAYIEDYVKENL